MFEVLTAKFVIKARACVAEDVVSFTDTVWLLGVVLVPLAVWLTDAVPWVDEVVWLAFAAELVVLAAWLLLSCDPLATPVADEPDAPEPALPCVFGADCKVVAASVELLAVAVLLALPCWPSSVAPVAFWVLVRSVATSLFVVALVIASFALSAASVAAWFNLSLVVWSRLVAPLISLFFLLRASSMALLASFWLSVKLGTFTAPIALIPLVCCELLFGELLEISTLSVVAAFTEWFVKLIPKMVTPNNTEATPTLSLRKL